MANTLARSLAQPMRALVGTGAWVPACEAEACHGPWPLASNNGTCVGSSADAQLGLGATRMRERNA